MTIELIAATTAVADPDIHRNFHEEAMAAVNELEVAIQRTAATKGLAEQLSNKGGWQTLWGTVTGSNDKDLATMIRELGGSVETTQAVLKLLLQMQTRKDGALKDFHHALVNKVESLQLDSSTLDANQRTMVLHFFASLRDQVHSQIAHNEMVDAHEHQIRVLQEAAKGLSRQLEEARTARETADGLLARQAVMLQKQACQLVDAEAALARQASDLQAAKARQDEQRADHDQVVGRVAVLDAVNAARSRWTARLAQHALPLLALAVGATALVRNWGA